jgi:hypothetical protein
MIGFQAMGGSESTRSPNRNLNLVRSRVGRCLQISRLAGGMAIVPVGAVRQRCLVVNTTICQSNDSGEISRNIFSTEFLLPLTQVGGRVARLPRHRMAPGVFGRKAGEKFECGHGPSKIGDDCKYERPITSVCLR